MVGKIQHPLAPRIKKMMQTDEDVGKISQLAPPLIACALDLLMRQLCTGAGQLAQERGVRTVSPSHLKSFILSEAKLDFLKDLVADVADLPPVDDTSPRKRPRANKSKKDEDSTSAPKARKSKSQKTPVKAEEALPCSSPDDPPEQHAQQSLAQRTQPPLSSDTQAQSNGADSHLATNQPLLEPQVKQEAVSSAAQGAMSDAAAPPGAGAGLAVGPAIIPVLTSAAVSAGAFADEDDYDAE